MTIEECQGHPATPAPRCGMSPGKESPVTANSRSSIKETFFAASVSEVFRPATPQYRRSSCSRAASLSLSEDQRKLNVCVLGTDAREALFSFADPIGKTILVNGRPFTVVGTMADSKGSMMGDNERDGAVLIPYGTYRKLMPWEEMHLLMIQSKEGMIERALDEVESLLRRRRKVKSNEPSNFKLSTADKFIEEFDSITATVGLIAIAISSIGLLVGGIGVMNIMLVSVTERTREIGIPQSHWRPPGRTSSFSSSSRQMTLTGIGGIFGVLLAVAVSYIIVSQIPDLPAIIPTWAIITGLGVSVAIGLLFGVWPARKAAQLDPIEALRYE